MKILFLNDCNGHEYKDPYATLVEISEFIEFKDLKYLEMYQLGALRTGGNLSILLKDLEEKKSITHKILYEGRKSTTERWWDYWEYKLISGNY